VAGAERRLAAASERIGEAQAAQYPRISIAGAFNLNRISALGQQANFRSWSIAPGLQLPLLDGRRRRAQVEQREAEYQEAYEAFRAQVARAVADTERAIGELAAARDRVAASETAVREYDRVFQSEQARLRAGRTSTTELERARRALLQASTAEVDAREGLAVGWVSLYRALGGGWQQAGGAAPSGEAPGAAVGGR
jgi:outer membrane protein TolC